MSDEITKKYSKLFDDIKQIDENGNEFWSARDLQTALGYSKWQSFQDVIEKAKTSARNSGVTVSISVLFTDVRKQLKKTNQHGTYVTEQNDIELARFACYLIAMNGESTKPQIAHAQSYFAIQTYQQEQLREMTDAQKRLYVRSQINEQNRELFESAKKSGVYRYGTFYDAGYLGLYGLSQKQLVQKKGIGKDKILDRAGTTELAANLFRITQTQDKLSEELNKGNKVGDRAASGIHFMVGGKVRQTIKDIGGTLPEDLRPEDENIKDLQKRLKADDKKKLLPAEKPTKLTGGFDANMKKISKANPPKEQK